ncbi:Cytochrome c oxidase subunit 6b-1 [Acorus calamus]|uniref:Cytochrome c oxidase subunit 6b-1 n=1 Tax=Acorus calamus TaxID=4465 RepID=A0AAV9EK96_ACOCL|nr:Cytochrome c oxidase subunit 6b-1 [Acorus calamus]
MAAGGDQEEKTLTLAQQWALKEIEEQAAKTEPPVQATEDVKPANSDSVEVVAEKTEATPATEEAPPTAEEATPATEEAPPTAEETPPAIGDSNPITEEATPATEDATPAVEEVSEDASEERSGEEVVSEESGIKIETAPADFRFPTTNQTRHCFTRYIEYHRCIAAKGEGASECDKFAKYYRALCPGEWVDRWNEQRENGTFPGPL